MRTLYSLVGLFLTALLAACGGGGSSDNTSPPNVSVSINSTTIQFGQSTTLNWQASDADSCTASGSWSGSQPTSGSVVLAPAGSGSYSYNLSCTGEGGTGTGQATLTVTTTPALQAGANSVPLIVDNGPTCTGCNGSLNVPFVTVTVCAPGSTPSTNPNNCRTIDHITVDTGSSGLRLLTSANDTSGNPIQSFLSALPVSQDSSGNTMGECIKFGDGFVFGGVRSLDLYMNGESATGISVQTIGEQPAGYTGIPSDCSSAGANVGTNESSLSAFGANGILGVSVAQSDCDGCDQAPSASNITDDPYYACTSSGCTATVPSNAGIVYNPVIKFANDNNGVVISLPEIGPNGATNPQGLLIFGIGTAANNQITNQTVYALDGNGNFTTQYGGQSYSASFLDSGSNALFFKDNSITPCSQSTGFYCPSSTLSLSATNTGTNGASGLVGFWVVNADTLPATTTAALIGGTYASFNGISGFDWGLPFFYGRNVFTAIEGATASGHAGPFVAY